MIKGFLMWHIERLENYLCLRRLLTSFHILKALKGLYEMLFLNLFDFILLNRAIFLW